MLRSRQASNVDIMRSCHMREDKAIVTTSWYRIYIEIKEQDIQIKMAPRPFLNRSIYVLPQNVESRFEGVVKCK